MTVTSMARIITLFAFLPAFWPGAAAQPAPQDTPALELIFLSVGQGDGVVIRSPEGRVVLVDAGPASGIVRVLREREIDSIDLAISTHPHADHIGGMDEVIRQLPVRYYMDNGVPHTTSIYRNLLRTVERSEVTYLAPVARRIGLGSLSLQVLPPPDGDTLALNNRSVGVVAEFGEFRALLTGDSEIEELHHFLRLGVPPVTVLKAAHHGSRDAVSPAWLSATKPAVVVISCGPDNPYGHPHPWALRYYQAVASEVYRTDRHGEVTVRGHRDGTYAVVTGEAASDSRPSPDSVTFEEPVTPAAEGVLSLWVFADAPGNDHDNLNGEYVVIRNLSHAAVVVGDWTLCDTAAHCFTLPAEAAIAPADSVVIYTGRGAADRHRYYMNRGQAVWNNRGDAATLRNRGGHVVIRYVY